MDITIDRDLFLKAIARVQTVVESRNTMPILSHVLLEASAEGTLSLTATDLEIAIKTTIDADVEIAGSIAVSAKKLYELVREMPSIHSVRLRSDHTDRCVITSGKSRFSLLGLPADDFPEYTTPEGSLRFSMDSVLLSKLIVRTHFAMTQDETRFALHGVCLEIAPGENGAGTAKMVATDTHRLNYAEAPILLATPITESMMVIVPKKGVYEARRLLDTKEREGQAAVVEICQSHLRIIQEKTVFTTKLVSGRFPNYHKVIPQKNAILVTTDKELFYGCVKRMAVLSSEKSHSILVRLGKNLLFISTANPDSEVAEEEIEVIYTGPQLSVGFNVKYLMEVINVVESNTIRFHFKDDESPVLVTDTEHDDYLFVLMPLRV